jgi:hypothetical protein
MWSPIEVYAAQDQRLLQKHYAKALFPAVVLIVSFLTHKQLERPKLEDSLAIGLQYLWSWLPVTIILTHRLFAVFQTNTTKQDRFESTSNLACIWHSILVTVLGTTVTFHKLNWEASSVIDIYSQTVGIQIGGLIWIMLLFGDLKKAGMIEESWIVLLAYFIISIMLLGPSSTLLVAWTWREYILARKAHWAAVTKVG